MRIVAIADLQNQCNKIKKESVPDGDMLIIAGDLTNYGDTIELSIFDNWLGSIKSEYRHIILCAGNHDLGLARTINGHTFFKNATYLQDELVEIEGLKIYGTPANNCGPYAKYWEFCDPSYIKRAASLIPDDIDILISHGPPYGILDQVGGNGEHIGDKALLEAVKRSKPRLHVFGHCHEHNGIEVNDSTTFVNAALCDDRNNLAFDPIIIDL